VGAAVFAGGPLFSESIRATFAGPVTWTAGFVIGGVVAAVFLLIRPGPRAWQLLVQCAAITAMTFAFLALELAFMALLTKEGAGSFIAWSAAVGVLHGIPVIADMRRRWTEASLIGRKPYVR
jgi:hypothetical protein